MRQTGGFALAAISTKSSPSSSANSKALRVGYIPSLTPSPGVNLTSGDMISLLMLCAFSRMTRPGPLLLLLLIAMAYPPKYLVKQQIHQYFL